MSKRSQLGFVLNTSLVLSQIIIGIISKSYITIGDSIDGLIDSFSLILPTILQRFKCDHECTNNRELEKTLTGLNLGIMIGFRVLLIINVVSEFVLPSSIEIGFLKFRSGNWWINHKQLRSSSDRSQSWALSW